MTMWKEIPNVEQQIVNCSLEQYKKLSKNGKPIINETTAEWTVLASIVLIHFVNKDNYSIQVISLGTGLKCLPFSKLCKTGNVLNDGHAEIMARRGFIRYLIEQINNKDSPFKLQDNKLVLNPHYSFHMYISQSPCGDASMTALAQAQTNEAFEKFESGKKRKQATEEIILMQNTYANKKQKTGNSFLHRGRFGFDTLGILRTKPGRIDSEPTLCMSCSDKLASWNVLGLQSALLSHMYNPIYLNSVVIGDMFDSEALERALYARLAHLHDLPSPYKLNKPALYHTDIPFESSKSILEATGKYTKIVSSSTSLSWVKGMPPKAEVFANGRKQGAPKGRPVNEKTRPSLSRRNLFQQLLNKEEPHVTTANYLQTKKNRTDYQNAKTCLLDQAFEGWVQTPLDLQDFNI